jgi:rhamnulose-1-phosphate aldolase
MQVTDLDFLKDFVRTADNGWQQGWHERNGGNMSYRLTPEEAATADPFLYYGGAWVPLGVRAYNLAEQYFCVTGTNRYFQNIARDPAANIGIIQLNERGDAYRVVWGLTATGKPTSELPTHILCLSVRAAATGGATRVIYHAHPVGVIALTFVTPAQDKAFTRLLWEAMTECVVIFPEGVGVLPWMVCGGREIALATAKKMEDYNGVIWGQHGIFIAGEDFDNTFGMLHAIEKAAQITLAYQATGKDVIGGITPDNLRAIGREFGFTIREEFLD